MKYIKYGEMVSCSVVIGGMHHLHRSEAGSVVDKGQGSSAPEECRSFMSGRPSQTPEQ